MAANTNIQPSRTRRRLRAVADAGATISTTPRPAVRATAPAVCAGDSPPAVPKSTSTELVPYTPAARAAAAPRSFRAQLTQLYQSATLSVHRMQNRPPKVKTAKVVVVVPAHNEEESIGRTIKALLSQTRQPDRIVIVADNCSDRTVEIARGFGRRVTVIETVGNRDRKVGALRTAWQQYVALATTTCSASTPTRCSPRTRSRTSSTSSR